MPKTEEEWIADEKLLTKKAYLSGMYEMCRILLTSPRMHKPQVEIIEGQAEWLMEQLKELGCKFKPL
jgi:hypothetical protein